MFKNWFHALGAGRKNPRLLSRAKPTLETLEDRTVPIAVQSYTAALLPQALSLNLGGPGVTISNMSYSGSLLGAGTFSNGTSDVGLASGVVLSTGKITSIPGHPTSTGNISTGNTTDGSNLGQAGDPLLSTAVPGPLYDDAAIINFNLVAQGPQVNLTFVYASNEFTRGTSTARDNDPFVVLVNGVNKALSGGLTITPGNLLSPANNGVLGNNDPTLSGGTGPLGVNFNGVTRLITISFSVTPGVSNAIHIVIADAGNAAGTTFDPTVDSAVFIGAQSVQAPARLSATFPTSWSYNSRTQTYFGYVTILNSGTGPLVLGSGAQGGLGMSQLMMQLVSMPWGVGVVGGKTFTVANTTIGVGQTIRIPVTLTNPFHVSLPTFFNSAGTKIVLTLTPSF